uniref:Sugar fermentation stimulation protein C-terminal domain-containing protein n=1 Tax=viral metagenome TaxID=1070528 RepID=A0A6C0ERN6_9ZZZZ
MATNNVLLQLPNLIKGYVMKRPSKQIKSPYVADIVIHDTNEEVIAHTAALGCCGLADTGAQVLMTLTPESKSGNKTQKCTHRIYLSIIHDKRSENNMNEVIVGINPKIAETLVENALKRNMLVRLQKIKSYRRETTIYLENQIDSRFDFTGIDENGIPFIMEVKNVPLADYEDLPLHERGKQDFSGRDWNSKIAYFPDGYRKKITDTISPRALKHICELKKIKEMSKTRCIICFVIQRDDVDRFQASVVDPEYRTALKNAVDSGVEVFTLVIKWHETGIAELVKQNLPIYFE